MDDKWIAHSLTMWGTLVTTLAAGIPAFNPMLKLMFGWTLDPAWVGSMDEGVRAIIGGLGTLFGLAMIIIGRFRATEPLKFFR